MKLNFAETYNTQERERKHLEGEMERYKALHEHVDEKYKQNLYNNASPSKNDTQPETRKSILKVEEVT